MFCYFILYYITLLYIIFYNSEPKEKLIYIYGCNLSLIVRLKFMNPWVDLPQNLIGELGSP